MLHHSSRFNSSAQAALQAHMDGLSLSSRIEFQLIIAPYCGLITDSIKRLACSVSYYIYSVVIIVVAPDLMLNVVLSCSIMPYLCDVSSLGLA